METTSQEPVKENNSVIGKTMSLAGIIYNEDIEKDARFLDELRKVLAHLKLPLSSLLLVLKLKRHIKMPGELWRKE